MAEVKRWPVAGDVWRDKDTRFSLPRLVRVVRAGIADVLVDPVGKGRASTIKLEAFVRRFEFVKGGE